MSHSRWGNLPGNALLQGQELSKPDPQQATRRSMTSAGNLRYVFKAEEQVFCAEPHVLLVERAPSAGSVAGTPIHWDTHLPGHPSSGMSIHQHTHPLASLLPTPLLQPVRGAGDFCKRLVPAPMPFPWRGGSQLRAMSLGGRR